MPGACMAPAGVLAVPEFRTLWLAELVSVAGDQLARVALALLVLHRTGSAFWAATAYATTFLPAVVGGVTLARLADRHRRRELMIACDLVRAGLVPVLAVPGLPVGVLLAVLAVVVLAAAPHTAAQGALLAQVLPRRSYEQGLAVRQVTGQVAQLVGFASGGLLVAVIGAPTALLLNAATFAVSALVLRLGVADRPAPAPPPSEGEGSAPDVHGLVVIFTDPRRRALVILAWTVGLFVLPEALAAPYALEIGAGPAVVGLLMAADPLGSALGAWLFVRFVPAAVRTRLIGVLAVAAGLPLLVTVAVPGVCVAVVCWALTGMLATAYLVQAQACFVRAVPDGLRGRAIGVAASGIVAAQGLAVLAGGALAEVTDAATAVAVGGAAGSLLAVLGALAWRSARSGETKLTYDAFVSNAA